MKKILEINFSFNLVASRRNIITGSQNSKQFLKNIHFLRGDFISQAVFKFFMQMCAFLRNALLQLQISNSEKLR